jgi:uncharacterized damage-inducible protein DinB
MKRKGGASRRARRSPAAKRPATRRARRPPSPRRGGASGDDGVLREQLVALLTKGHAHVTLDRALAGLRPELRGRRPAPGVHSVYEELEHMRLAQEDILRYTLDPAWRSPQWPEGYWPPEGRQPDAEEWERTLSGFRSDLAEVCALARDPKRVLTDRIPHGEGRTYLRQVLLVADHNAYHLGEIVQTRKLLGAWKSS